MGTWETIALAVLAVGILFWMLPGIRQASENSKDAPKDWAGLLLPIAVVVGFILLLIASV